MNKQKRCAIYTRKSTDEGLEQDFNSLDAQRMAAENYIASQKHEGWICLPERYDDGGFSGGNLERPALKKLLEDVEKGKIDIIVVTRSTASPGRCWIFRGSSKSSTNTRPPSSA